MPQRQMRDEAASAPKVRSFQKRCTTELIRRNSFRCCVNETIRISLFCLSFSRAENTLTSQISKQNLNRTICSCGTFMSGQDEKKPAIGQAPSHLFDESATVVSAISRAKRFVDFVISGRGR